ncbi:hypothetical protein QWZ10_00450 [Paracoccus cavernae]|uniref:Peptidoglycan binding-like domain-containing protein n=1 Tax=Paracoccus cavernae TaxID=1571207 RepID=A0ABT8D426_9RHOB|nr:hypothetical protein [Paracoccus cavernae]
MTTAADRSQSRAEMDRLDIMMQAYNRNRRGFSLHEAPRHWQQWDNLRAALGELAEVASPGQYRVGTGPAGGAVETIPGPYADGVTGLLAKGQPVVTSTFATAFGHVMTAIGAVVRHDGTAEWLIMNDPNGTLASADSLYGTLALREPVGLNGTNDPADLRAVQEALIRTGHYRGAPGAPVDSADPADPTIAAIRAFQGSAGDGLVSPGGETERRINARIGQGTRTGYSAGENETNRATDERGRHVYYNGETEGNSKGQFRLKGQAWSSVIEPVTPLTTAQIAARLNPGVAAPEPAVPAVTAERWTRAGWPPRREAARIIGSRFPARGSAVPDGPPAFARSCLRQPWRFPIGPLRKAARPPILRRCAPARTCAPLPSPLRPLGWPAKAAASSVRMRAMPCCSTSKAAPCRHSRG